MFDKEVPVGTRLGKYCITGKFGQGGMGTVYTGQDVRLRRTVAIKILPSDFAADPELLKRFLLEARAAAQLNHPNVVTVHDIGKYGNTYFFVMELIAGGSVQTLLGQRGPLPWAEATRIVIDVCRGLAAVHGAGLIHRDVKPANILLADTTAKLADFGLVKSPDLLRANLTQLGCVLGTVHYMSPENCTGGVLDVRTDLYSLGATYYTMLVGQPPYTDADPVKILYAHCSSPIPDPRSLRAELPAQCGAIIARAMAKTPTERFSSADEMLASLHALLEPASTASAAGPAPAMVSNPAPPASNAPAVSSNLARATPWLAFAAVLALLSIGALVAGGGLLYAFFFRSPPPSTPAPLRAEEQLPPVKKSITLRSPPSMLAKHQGSVKAVSLAAGRLASAGSDGKALVWSLADRQVVHALAHDVALDAVALSPDGKLLAAGGLKKSVTLWDADTGKAIHTLDNLAASISALAFSPTGKQLAVATQTDLRLFEVTESRTLRFVNRLLQQEYVVASIAYSSDGKRFAACTAGQKVMVWDLDTKKSMQTAGKHPGRMNTVALSSDGKHVAFGMHDGPIYLWQPDRDVEPTLLSKNEGSISSTVFAPNSDTLVFAGEWAGPLRVYDLASTKLSRVASGVETGRVEGLAFAPDGKLVAAACSDGMVRLWETQAVENAGK